MSHCVTSPSLHWASNLVPAATFTGISFQKIVLIVYEFKYYNANVTFVILSLYTTTLFVEIGLIS